MFTELDDRTPPVATMAVRERVDHRTLALADAQRRTQRRARLGFVAAVVALVLVVGGAVAVGRGGSSRSEEPVASSTTIQGHVLAKWDFRGSPSTADAETTVARLNRRFTDLHYATRAELTGGQVVVVQPAGTAPPSKATMYALAQPGRFELRPVLEEELVPEKLHAGGTGTLVAWQYTSPLPGGHSTALSVYLLGPVAMDGSAVQSATSDLADNGQWEVRPVLWTGAAGIGRLNAIAPACFDHDSSCASGQLAMVFDGRVLSAPTIDAPSFPRDGISIMGGLDQQTAHEIAAMLDSGELPAPLRLR